MSKELLAALDVLESEKGISKEIVKEALEAALVSAYKKNYGQAQNVQVEFDDKKGDIHVYSVKEVVEDVYDSTLEISLEDALEINKAYELGDTIRFEVTPKNFGRIAAQTAKQVILQRVREAERTNIYNEYIQYEDDLMQGIVERQDNRYIYVNLGKIEAVLSKQEQIPGEVFNAHDRIKVYVNKVDNTAKGPQVFVSRSHPNLIKRLFEQEVPEIYDGVVEIISIAREAGDRAKIAVKSTNENVDPVGTCVGPRGQRVQTIVNELRGENMDIVEWHEDPAVYIANALNPAQVVEVNFNKDSNSCLVVVPDYQLSLAIGKKGQNVRLAAKLTGYKIDIKSESEMEKLRLKDQVDKNLPVEQSNDFAETIETVAASEEHAEINEMIEDLEDKQPGEQVFDTDYEKGELASEDAEDLIESAEERKNYEEE
ncbi:transcription termination factor NusA [Lacticigenium naphthae]|uniref:transcription termination factor NusA n=1 Tax=Lacticigenium naphthae TaxID=515351 RepID=UPI0003F7D574|nr:transcription termination factor NusA [Lacticigenium naphthae]